MKRPSRNHAQPGAPPGMTARRRTEPALSRSLFILLLIAGLIAGCAQNRYEIRMRPEAAGVRRDLSWERLSQDGANVKSQPSPAVPAGPGEPTIALEALARVAALYGARAPDRAVRKVEFSGKFADRLPPDVGGHGQVVRYPTSLGTLFVYAERFRGNDDLAGQWERRQAAPDAIVDVLISWAAAKWTGRPEADRIRQFLDRDFRRDLRNAMAYTWLAVESLRLAQPGEMNLDAIRHAAGAGMRFAQYAVEHGYLEPAEAPALIHALQQNNAADDPALMLLLRRMIVRKLELNPDDPVLTSMDTLAALRTSIEAHLNASPASSAQLAAWARRAGVPGEAASEHLDAALRAAAWFPLLSDFDEVHVSLALDNPPVMTNGVWDPEQRRVTWSLQVEVNPTDAFGLPKFCYAIWAVPDPSWQTARFGRVAVTGAHLADYCFWRAGLPDAQAARWDEFLRSLPRGPEGVAQLRAFRFPGEEDDKDPPPGAAAVLKALTNE